jgi:hypothetical protein
MFTLTPGTAGTWEAVWVICPALHAETASAAAPANSMPMSRGKRLAVTTAASSMIVGRGTA